MQQLQNVQTYSTVGELWKQYSAALTSLTIEVFGLIQRRPMEVWFDAECKKAIQGKNEARKKGLGILRALRDEKSRTT